jgi:diguanylate cyclase (GGDEF)-like protein
MKKENTQNINDQIIYEIMDNKFFTSDFISSIAGDKILTNEEREMYDKIIKEANGELYVKILFFITHHVFFKKEAKKLWEEILKHKYEISKALNRNVEITIATLDYLTHVKDKIKNPKLIGESFMGKLVELSSSDGLTKLYNRSYLLLKMKEELRRFKRYKTTFSFIILDIDDFKKINDQLGHQKGDEILSKLGNILNNSRRDLDICARYGGEEFAIVLPHTCSSEAKVIAERIRKKVKNFFQKENNLTISLGVSNCPESSAEIVKIIKMADDALYESKKGGKNKTTFK